MLVYFPDELSPPPHPPTAPETGAALNLCDRLANPFPGPGAPPAQSSPQAPFTPAGLSSIKSPWTCPTCSHYYTVTTALVTLVFLPMNTHNHNIDHILEEKVVYIWIEVLYIKLLYIYIHTYTDICLSTFCISCNNLHTTQPNLGFEQCKKKTKKPVHSLILLVSIQEAASLGKSYRYVPFCVFSMLLQKTFLHAYT